MRTVVKENTGAFWGIGFDRAECCQGADLRDRGRAGSDVLAGVACHPGTRAALQHIPGAVAEFFPDADLRLEVRADPESASDERLGIYIRTGMDSESAVEQLIALDAAWGDRLHELTDGGLLLNVEAKA